LSVPLRFGILGARPARVSRLGRNAINTLLAAGYHLTIWLEGDGELPLPWGLDGTGPLADLPPSTVVVDRHAGTVLEELAAVRPDFLLQLDEVPPAPQMLDIPRFGVWRFAAALAPLAFWEVFDGLYHAEIRLDRLTHDAALRIPLERRWIKVERHSYRQTLDSFIGEMTEMLVYVGRCAPGKSPGAIAFPPQRFVAPTVLQRAHLRVKLGIRNVLRQLAGLFFSETWRIGVVASPIESFADLDYLPSPRWLPNPGVNRFLADPFVVRTGSGFRLLAEDYDFSTDRGSIVQEFSQDGHFTGQMQDALREDCHMSYPYLLEHRGELYCIPEIHQKNGVFAWRWDSAAGSWREPREILPGLACIDPTMVFFDGLWWLFCTDKRNGPDSKLHIYHASGPWGPWTPHARNPVKVDIRSSRPGGAPFVLRGQLYRPAQDSSKHYGWRLAINRVTKLSPVEFAEETLRILDSDRLGASGVHTLSGAGPWSVVDARAARFTPWRFPGVLRHKLRRLR
jgi:hypothetical protein